MLGHAAGVLFFFRERRRRLRQRLGGVGGLLLVAFGGGRVEVGDVFFQGEAFDGLAGRELRWGRGLAWRERGRCVVGH